MMRTIAALLALTAYQPDPGPNTVKSSAIQTGAVTTPKLSVSAYTRSGLPNATTYSGSLAVVTDHEKGIYQSDGTTWQPVDPLQPFSFSRWGGIPNSSGAAATNSTVWSNIVTAIQTLSVSDPTLTSGTVLFGPGTWHFSHKLTVSAGMHIIGAGDNFDQVRTQILVPPGGPAFFIDPGTTPYNSGQFSTFEFIEVEPTQDLAQVPRWSAATAVTVGTVWQPTVYTGMSEVVTAVSGDAKTGSVEPTWPDYHLADYNAGDGVTTSDNHVTWTARESPGFDIQAQVYMNHVTAKYFIGDGFHFVGTGGNSTSLSTCDHCYAIYNAGWGMYMAGNDANAMHIESPNMEHNYYGGINDNSFLGNITSHGHTSGNGLAQWSATTPVAAINYGAHPNTWSLTPFVPNGHSYYSVLGGTTGATEPAWCVTAGCTTTPLDGSVTWIEYQAYNGASYACSDNISGCLFDGDYAEGGQGPVRLHPTSSLSVNGDYGVGFDTGAGNLGHWVSGGTSNFMQIQSPLTLGVSYNNTRVGDNDQITSLRSTQFDSGGSPIGDMIFQWFGGNVWAWTSSSVWALGLSTPTFPSNTGGIATGAAGLVVVPNAITFYTNNETSLTAKVTVPSSGAWATGDVVLKQTASGGKDPVLGWRCSAGGSPGTWEVIYNPIGAPQTPTAGTTQTQAGATALTGSWAVVAVGNAGDGVILPTEAVGRPYTVCDADAVKAMQLYCIGACKVNTATNTTGISVAAGICVSCRSDGTNEWCTKP